MKDPFINNNDAGQFINSILEDIHGCLINHHCASLPNNSPYQSPIIQISSELSVFGKNLLVNMEPYLSRFDKCTCIDDQSELMFKDIVKFIVRKSDKKSITWFCDMSKNVFKLN